MWYSRIMIVCMLLRSIVSNYVICLVQRPCQIVQILLECALWFGLCSNMNFSPSSLPTSLLDLTYARLYRQAPVPTNVLLSRLRLHHGRQIVRNMGQLAVQYAPREEVLPGHIVTGEQYVVFLWCIYFLFNTI